MNNVVLVGRIRGIEEDTNTIIIETTVKESTLLPIKLSHGIADSVKEYCKVNDVIGVKGSLTCDETTGNVLIIAERISFLTSKVEEE